MRKPGKSSKMGQTSAAQFLCSEWSSSASFVGPPVMGCHHSQLPLSECTGDNTRKPKDGVVERHTIIVLFLELERVISRGPIHCHHGQLPLSNRTENSTKSLKKARRWHV